MNESAVLPAEIEVRDQWPGGIRYILPRRQLGKVRWLGGPLFLFGAVLFLILAWEVASTIGAGPHGWMIPALFAGLMTWGGLTPMWWGLTFLFGHRELEIRAGSLLTVERVGPFWRSKRWSVEQIRSLQVKRASAQVSPPAGDILEPFNALVLHRVSGKQGMLAWGYPLPMLHQFALVLAERCEAAVQMKGLAGSQSATTRPAIPVLAPTGEPRASCEVASNMTADDIDSVLESMAASTADADGPLPPPPGSTIELETHAGGDLTVRVPPAGVLKGSHGLFSFSLIWCGFMMLFDGLAFYSAWHAGKFDNFGVLLGFSALFWLIGIGLLLAAINMGRREGAIAVVDNTLMALQTGLFGSKRREWQFDQIERIGAGPSGMEVNDRPVLELQIHDLAGQKFGLLAGRSDAELHWLASILRQSLRSSRMGEAMGEDSSSTA